MPLHCEDILALLGSFSLVKQCDALRDGTLRIATPFQYPNGSFIDVFLQETKNLPDSKRTLFAGHLLSDLGQTATYLLDLHIKIAATKKRRQIVQDVCQGLGVELQRGELMVRIEGGALNGTLASSIFNLSQACLRVADLSFTQRFTTPLAFKDEVEEFLNQAEFQYETDVILTTKFHKDVVIDFRVQGPKKPSLVKTVSASNP